VAAKEIERQLGVTYKTAWRMAKQIRLLFAQGDQTLSGTVETDETYVGGKKAWQTWTWRRGENDSIRNDRA
jgi:hypothetical protein